MSQLHEQDESPGPGELQASGVRQPGSIPRPPLDPFLAGLLRFLSADPDRVQSDAYTVDQEAWGGAPVGGGYSRERRNAGSKGGQPQ
jgi:hypothetical protein